MKQIVFSWGLSAVAYGLVVVLVLSASWRPSPQVFIPIVAAVPLGIGLLRGSQLRAPIVVWMFVALVWIVWWPSQGDFPKWVVFAQLLLIYWPVITVAFMLGRVLRRFAGGWIPTGRPQGPHGGPAQPSFEKFSARARRALSRAQEEAERLNHNYIGPEHILLGLVRETDGVAARVLSSLGVELPKVRSAVEFIIGRGGRPSPGDVGLTPRAKTVIELAVAEARGLGHGYIGVEHLLIGLMREGEGVAAGVLESLGVRLDDVVAEVSRVLGRAGE